MQWLFVGYYKYYKTAHLYGSVPTNRLQLNIPAYDPLLSPSIVAAGGVTDQKQRPYNK